MKIGQRGLNLIKEYEGCLKPIGGGKYVPYVCPAGVLTIGWGTTNLDGKKFDKYSVWTKAQCDAALANDMVKYEKAVERLVKVDLNQNQFDAVVSFTYNCGEGALAKSTLLKRLNAGNFPGAAAQFKLWNKGGGKVLRGLVRRREAEAALFKLPPPMEHELPPLPPPPDIEPPQAEPDDTKPHAAPSAAPKSGVTEGAKVAGGVGLAGLLTQVWDALKEAPDTILQAVVSAAKTPTFWLFAASIGAAGYIWWRRSNMKKANQ